MLCMGGLLERAAIRLSCRPTAFGRFHLGSPQYDSARRLGRKLAAKSCSVAMGCLGSFQEQVVIRQADFLFC